MILTRQLGIKGQSSRQSRGWGPYCKKSSLMASIACVLVRKIQFCSSTLLFLPKSGKYHGFPKANSPVDPATLQVSMMVGFFAVTKRCIVNPLAWQEQKKYFGFTGS